MIDKIEQLKQEIVSYEISDNEQLEQFRLKYISKKGLINDLFSEFKTIPNEQKKLVGQKINELKNLAQEQFQNAQNQLKNSSSAGSKIQDKTRPPYNSIQLGTRHPVSIIKNNIIDIFKRIGFVISEGPEIEDDWHVFSALNFPPNHPARDMQDTFFIEKEPDVLLRTHTSSVQVRAMKENKPPLRIIMPGRVFRNEAISARAHCIFHQVEGLYIDTDVSFADLKQTLEYFAKEMFGTDTEIRLRPSYFPFTEPSAELDISCTICKGDGCNLCKYTGWIEILGCGMVDPNVLKLSNIDPDKYTGFAFGMGIERIAILKYQIKDIRYLFENDLKFLRQFNPLF